MISFTYEEQAPIDNGSFLDEIDDYIFILIIQLRMEFFCVSGQNVSFTNLFNEEHTGEILASINSSISTIEFHNVGIKVMRLILGFFEEANLRKITVDYCWNTIMTTPALVCYDKNQWKSLQQLSNWNREWNELFNACYSVAEVDLKIRCSWMDDQFVRKLLEGVVRLPNIQSVAVELGSKSKAVEEVLIAFQKAQLFPQYKYAFKQLK